MLQTAINQHRINGLSNLVNTMVDDDLDTYRAMVLSGTSLKFFSIMQSLSTMSYFCYGTIQFHYFNNAIVFVLYTSRQVAHQVSQHLMICLSMIIYIDATVPAWL